MEVNIIFTPEDDAMTLDTSMFLSSGQPRGSGASMYGTADFVVQNLRQYCMVLSVAGVQGDAERRADGGSQGSQGPGPPRSGAEPPPHATCFDSNF